MIGCDCSTCRSTDPRDRRLRPSIFIQTDDDTAVLVDAGPDLREQALRHRIRRVDAIVFTHGHADHILGMDDVRRFNFMQKRPMPCYGDARTIADIRQTFAYAFDPRTQKGGGLPQIVTFTVEGAFSVGHQEVVPVPLYHGQRAILGWRFGTFAYLTDCNRIPETSWALARGARRARDRRAPRSPASHAFHASRRRSPPVGGLGRRAPISPTCATTFRTRRRRPACPTASSWPMMAWW